MDHRNMNAGRRYGFPPISLAILLMACGAGDSAPEENVFAPPVEPPKLLAAPQLARISNVPPATLTASSGLLMFGEGSSCDVADMDMATGVVVDRWSPRFMNGCDGYRAENGEVIYINNRTSPYKVTIYNPATKVQQVVATCTAGCGYPSLNATGTVFSFLESTTSGGVLVYSRAGVQLAYYPREGSYDRAVFTPDNRLLFSSRNQGLVLTDTTFKIPTVIFPSHLPMYDWPSMPAVSPDGRWVFFKRTGIWDERGMYVVGIDGTGVQQLTEKVGMWPTWSPDGSHIAFIYNSWIWCADLATGVVPPPYLARYAAMGPLTWQK